MHRAKKVGGPISRPPVLLSNPRRSPFGVGKSRSKAPRGNTRGAPRLRSLDPSERGRERGLFLLDRRELPGANLVPLRVRVRFERGALRFLRGAVLGSSAERVDPEPESFRAERKLDDLGEVFRADDLRENVSDARDDKVRVRFRVGADDGTPGVNRGVGGVEFAGGRDGVRVSVNFLTLSEAGFSARFGFDLPGELFSYSSDPIGRKPRSFPFRGYD